MLVDVVAVVGRFFDGGELVLSGREWGEAEAGAGFVFVLEVALVSFFEPASTHEEYGG